MWFLKLGFWLPENNRMGEKLEVLLDREEEEKRNDLWASCIILSLVIPQGLLSPVLLFSSFFHLFLSCLYHPIFCFTLLLFSLCCHLSMQFKCCLTNLFNHLAVSRYSYWNPLWRKFAVLPLCHLCGITKSPGEVCGNLVKWYLRAAVIKRKW